MCKRYFMAGRVIWLALVLSALVAPPAHGARQLWQFRTFTTRDGLSHDIVRDVLEARDGALWFATMAGLTRYEPDACRYRHLTIPGPSQEAMSLAEGPDGAIWVATQGGGISRWRAGRWRRFTSKDGLPSDEITSLFVDRRGRLWATPTTGGIAMLDLGPSAAGRGRLRFRSYTRADGLSDGEIGRCADLRSGVVLCATYDQPVLQRFDGQRWSQLTVDAPARRHFYVHTLAEGKDGRLWLATKGTGAIEGRPEPARTEGATPSYRWRVHDTSRGVASNRVGAVLPLDDGDVWVATSAGVSWLDATPKNGAPKNGATGGWRTLSRRDGLGADLVFAISRDREGALWFATLGGGVSRYASSRWQHVGEALASRNVSGGILRARDGTLWVGTDRGLSRRAPAPGSGWETEQTGSVSRDYVNHLLEAEGAIWVATRDGVRRLRDGRWEHFAPDPTGKAGPAQAVVNRLAYQRRKGPGTGLLWAATARGLSRYDGQTWRTYRRAEGLPADRVNAVLVGPRDRVWAATSNGLAELVGDRFRPHLNAARASRTNRVYSIVRGRGATELWASGLESVSRSLDGKTWRRVPPSPWLPAGIYSRFAMRTDDGSLWFAIRGLGVRRLSAERWTSYSTAEGLAADTVRDVERSPDGALLFATIGGGLSRYRPDRRPPQTWIGRRPPSRASAAASLRVIRGERLVIGFSGQDVLKDTPTEALVYSHRIDGGPWSAFTRATGSTLPDLPAGDHLFEVRAMDRDLNVDPSPARQAFRVVRPWFAQPWLIGLSLLALALLVLAAVRTVRAAARERAAMQHEQAMLAQRGHFVRLASHELRKPLTRLAHRAELLALPSTLAKPEQARGHAEAMIDDSGRLARLVDSLLHQARLKEGLQITPIAGPLQRTVTEVVDRFVGEQPDDARPRLELPEAEVVVAHDPFYLELALRNLLDNARKYAPPLDAVTLTLSAPRGARFATLLVADRGPGIPAPQRPSLFEPFQRGRTAPEHAGFGLGLGFARDIARAHGGELTLDAAADARGGSTFRLTLPLSPAT